MDRIQKYVYKQLNIGDMETYLIYPEHYRKVLEFLNLYSASWELLDIVENVKAVDLYPALVYIPRLAEKYRWRPILCYRNGDEFHHVHYHSGWMCRECWTNNGPVILPMSEVDNIYGFPLPPILEVFQKVNCKKCGKTLQNHLIMIEQ